ncbi:hypothetical protein L6452_06030 [Arctium lappa]|uniref:Uncharacterized protein n=1 Tax=Arctium lappa TaxID=4217 RepID=A0ACB9EHZ1_ARCLA|nr:hypothetical protein L6452_06030 [Arctium lappa]
MSASDFALQDDYYQEEESSEDIDMDSQEHITHGENKRSRISEGAYARVESAEGGDLDVSAKNIQGSGGVQEDVENNLQTFEDKMVDSLLIDIIEIDSDEEKSENAKLRIKEKIENMLNEKIPESSEREQLVPEPFVAVPQAEP